MRSAEVTAQLRIQNANSILTGLIRRGGGGGGGTQDSPGSRGYIGINMINILISVHIETDCEQAERCVKINRLLGMSVLPA